MKKSGFTLMELMVAAAILASVLLGILGVFTACFVLNETAENLTLAINAAQQEVERIRNLGFSQISAEDGSSFEIAGIADINSEGAIAVDSSEPTLLEVTVTVCWRQVGGRIIGEARDISGDLVIEDLNKDGSISSPAQIVTLIAER